MEHCLLQRGGLQIRRKSRGGADGIGDKWGNRFLLQQSYVIKAEDIEVATEGA